MDKKKFGVMLALWQYISLKRRQQLGLLLFLTVLSAFSEMLSLGIVLPFIGVVTNPDTIFSSPIVAYIAHWFGITSGAALLLPLTIGFAILALVAGILRLLLIWTSLRLSNAIGTDLGIDMYRKTLYQPYSVHVARNSSKVITGITQKVSAVTSVIISGVACITNGMLFVSIMGSMLIIAPKVSIVATLCFGMAYCLIAWSTRYRLMRNSLIIAQEQTDVMKSLQEGLGAIRDILLEGAQETYCNIYRRAVLKLQRARTENTCISQAPRYAIETFALILVALFVLLMSSRPAGVMDALPILGFLALGAQRLLPIMQQVYGNWSELAGNKGAFSEVLQLLNQPLPEDADQLEPLTLPLPFCSEIRFHNVSFRYENTSTLILDDVSFVIPKGARIGIVGATGAGKSTVLDLLMGLLEPTQGTFSVDGQVVNKSNRRVWQRTIAHVPQVIFLADSSIAENIAFGIPVAQIDYQRVREAAIRANAHTFIEASSAGYQTLVGERGVRLSGGQRQRIGIARALYKKATVLCFDEATSALDTNTEQDVMDAIDSLDEDLTVLIIAHRLTTLVNCTHFLRLIDGKVKLIGSYSALALECE